MNINLSICLAINVKYKWKITWTFVAFSENLNFINGKKSRTCSFCQKKKSLSDLNVVRKKGISIIVQQKMDSNIILHRFWIHLNWVIIIKKGKRGKTRKNQGRLCDVFSCIGVYLIRMASMYCYEIWLSDRLMLYIVQCGPSMTSWSIYILSLFWSIYMYHFWPY